MRRPVYWAQSALDEIKDIACYIAADNPQAARQVASALRRAGDKLGQMATGHKGRVSGTYEKLIAKLPYIISYVLHVLPDGKEAITILRIIHTARNWPEEAWPEEK